MNSEIVIAIIAGLGGMLGWGLADFFAKKTIDRIGDVVSLVWAHIFGTLVLFVIVMYQIIANGIEIITSIDALSLILLVFFGLLQAAVYILVYRGFSKGQISILSPIFASFSGLVAVFSIIFLGEIISGYIILTLAGIFAGVILLSFDVEAWKAKRYSLIHTPGAKEILLATVLAAIWTITWDGFIYDQNWIVYALFMYIFMTIGLLIYSKLQRIKLSFSKQQGVWKFLVLIGVCEVVAYFAISYGYSSTSLTSVIALLSGAFSLPVIILAKIFLKEKMTKIQILGIILVILGIMLVPVI